MLYRILADLAVLVHFLWILFLIFGAVWGRHHMGVKLLHLAGLAFALVLHLFSLICPLTHVEIYFRSLAEQGAPYKGSFIIHYVDKLIYISLPPLFLLALTAGLCIFNGLLYLRPRKR